MKSRSYPYTAKLENASGSVSLFWVDSKNRAYTLDTRPRLRVQISEDRLTPCAVKCRPDPIQPELSLC